MSYQPKVFRLNGGDAQEVDYGGKLIFGIDETAYIDAYPNSAGNLVITESTIGNGAQVHFGVDGDGIDVKFFGTTASAYVLWDESADSLIFSGAAGLSIAGTGRLAITAAPASYILPSLGVGVYGTPVVDASDADNIAFTVNLATATNKTAADSSCMAAFIGCANTADTANNKMQGLLVSTTLHGDVFDAYGVQGHITVHDEMGTANANAHITGLSGKALLSAAVTQGWVTGVLGIIDGTGAVTGLCHAIAGQIEAGVTGADAILYLGADASTPAAITLSGATNITDFLVIDSAAGFVSAKTDGDLTFSHYRMLHCMIGGLHGSIPIEMEA